MVTEDQISDIKISF